MQTLKRCVRILAQGCTTNVISQQLKVTLPLASFHTSSVRERQLGPKKFLSHNYTMFPVQGPDEERRPAYVCHTKANLKYSLKKMWYIASFVRGMSVDEAVKQLSYVMKKGAIMVKETILEAQQMAVEKHNVEFKSNLWVAESFATKGVVIKGMRRHAKKRVGEVRYGYVHYYVRLEEGKPPAEYYANAPKSKDELLEDWKNQMRQRKIYNSL